MTLFKNIKKATVQDVHNEFDSQADNLLSEAKTLLKDREGKGQGFWKELSDMGFSNSPSVKDVKPAVENATLIRDYNLHYPQNNFLTEEKIGEICKKYGLLFASTEKYIGEIPVANQKEMVSFKLRDEDTTVTLWDEKKQKETIAKSTEALKKASKSRNSSMGMIGLSVGIIYLLGLIGSRKTIAKSEWIRDQEDWKEKGFTLKGDATSYHIVATPNLIDQKNAHVEGEYKVVDDDPVVFVKVNGGYLQISAWGDESKLAEFQTPNKN